MTKGRKDRPALGKITSFFRPFAIPRKPETFDGDEIFVARSKTRIQPTPPHQDKSSGSSTSLDPNHSQEHQDTVAQSQHLNTIKRPSTPLPPPQEDSLTATSSPLTPITSHFSTPLSVRTIKTSAGLGLLETITSPAFETAEAITHADPLNITSSFSSTASKRVVVNGVSAVTNSDADSVSSSSEDDFADVSCFVPRKRRKVTPPGTSAARAIELLDDETDTLKPAITTRCNRRQAPGKQEKKVYRHSLAHLVKQSERDSATASRIKQAEVDVDDAYSRDLQAADSHDDIAAKVLGDGSDQDRVKAAISRIEVLQDTDVFRFFHGRAIPEQTLQGEPDWQELKPILADPADREVAITSGFLADIAQTIGLSEEIMIWVYEQLQHESSAVLCEAYLDILSAVNQANRSHAALQECLLRELYPASSDDQRAQHIPYVIPQNLRYILRATRTLLTRNPSSRVRADALVDLIHLNIDEVVRSSPDLQQEIESAMLASLERDNMLDIIELAVQQTIHHSTLSQRQLYSAVATLPATSLGLHRLRRSLAQQCLLPSEKVDQTSPDIGDRLIDKLKHDEICRIGNDTNWTHFHRTVQLLDITIDMGFSDFSFIRDSASCEGDTEKAFNAQIDELAQQLRLIANNIHDAGTSHLKRAEAKSALERLIMRLELSVRTRPRRKAATFGGFIGQQNFLQNFLDAANSDEEVRTNLPGKSPAKALVKDEICTDHWLGTAMLQ